MSDGEMEKEKIRQISWMIEANQWRSHKAIKIAQFYYHNGAFCPFYASLMNQSVYQQHMKIKLLSENFC